MSERDGRKIEIDRIGYAGIVLRTTPSEQMTVEHFSNIEDALKSKQREKKFATTLSGTLALSTAIAIGGTLINISEAADFNNSDELILAGYSVIGTGLLGIITLDAFEYRNKIKQQIELIKDSREKFRVIQLP